MAEKSSGEAAERIEEILREGGFNFKGVKGYGGATHNGLVRHLLDKGAETTEDVHRHIETFETPKGVGTGVHDAIKAHAAEVKAAEAERAAAETKQKTAETEQETAEEKADAAKEEVTGFKKIGAAFKKVWGHARKVPFKKVAGAGVAAAGAGIGGVKKGVRAVKDKIDNRSEYQGTGAGWLLLAILLYFVDNMMRSGRLEPAISTAQAFNGANLPAFLSGFTLANSDALIQNYIVLFAVPLVILLLFWRLYDLKDVVILVGAFAIYALISGANVELGWLSFLNNSLAGSVTYLATFNVFAYLIFGYLLIIVPFRKGETDIILLQILIFLSMALIFFGGRTLGVFLHLTFAGLYLFMFIKKIESDAVNAYVIIAFWLLIDFFFFSWMRIYGPGSDGLSEFPFIPVWWAVTAWFAMQRTKSIVVRMAAGLSITVFVLLVGIFVVQGTGIADVRGVPGLLSDAVTGRSGPESESPEDEDKTPLEEGVDSIKDTKEKIQGFFSSQLAFATGTYVEAQVDRTAEPLGLFFENFEFADFKYYEDDEVTVWADLVVQTLDQTVDVALSCELDKDSKKFTSKNGSVDPQRIENIDSTLAESVTCRFEEDELEVGQHTATIYADFNFQTTGRRKTYLMREERVRADRREGIDSLEGKVVDRNPPPWSSPGPIAIGIGLPEPPIGIGDDISGPALTVTVENRWPGTVENFDEFLLYLPEGFALDESKCNNLFKEIDPDNQQQENVYTLVQERLNELEKDLDEETQASSAPFKSFRCRLNAEDRDALLGEGPLSVKEIRAEATYRYATAISRSFNVNLPEGFNVNVKAINPVVPGDITSADRVACIATHSDRNIIEMEYTITVFDIEGEEVRGPEQLPASCVGGSTCDADITAPFVRDNKLHCFVTAELDDGTIETHADTVLVKNGPPVITAKFDQFEIEKPVICRATIREFDGDELRSVDYTLSYELPSGITGEDKKFDVVCTSIAADRGATFICDTNPLPADVAVDGTVFSCQWKARENSGRENSRAPQKTITRTMRKVDVPAQIREKVAFWSNEFGIRTDIALALVEQESSFTHCCESTDPKSREGGTCKKTTETECPNNVLLGPSFFDQRLGRTAHAIGAGQVTEGTAATVCSMTKEDLANLEKNLECSMKILAIEKARWGSAGCQTAACNQCIDSEGRSFSEYRNEEAMLRAYYGWPCGGTYPQLDYVPSILEKAEQYS